jgi:hypothetical protein
MAGAREKIKVDDDPLSMFLGSGAGEVSVSSKPASSASVEPRLNTQCLDQPDLFLKRSQPFAATKQRKIGSDDTSPLPDPHAQEKLKENNAFVGGSSLSALGAIPTTTAPVFPSPSPVPVASPPVLASSTSKPQSVPTKVAPTHRVVEEDEADIFGLPEQAPVTKSRNEFAEEDSLFSTKSKKQVSSAGVLRLGNERVDDERLDDLQVNKMLEKEEDLDYAMFGTSNAIMGGGNKKAYAESAAPSVNKSRVLDDSILHDSIFDLEINDKKVNIASSAVQFIAPIVDPVPAVASSAGVFDINAYIQNQSADSGGGLFD